PTRHGCSRREVPQRDVLERARRRLIESALGIPLRDVTNAFETAGDRDDREVTLVLSAAQDASRTSATNACSTITRGEQCECCGRRFEATRTKRSSALLHRALNAWVVAPGAVNPGQQLIAAFSERVGHDGIAGRVERV